MRRERSGCVGVAMVAVTLSSSSARTEEARERSAPCSSEASATPRTQDEEVAALYGAFECHFSRQEFAACLPLLEKACSLTHSPRCFLNLGAVHHALMQCEPARGFYQEYLLRVPYDEEGDDARKALEELSMACPQVESAAADKPELEASILTPDLLPHGTHNEPSPGPGAAPSPSDGALPPPAGLPLKPSDDPQIDRRAAPLEVRRDATARDSRETQRIVAWSLLGAGAASAVSMALAAGYGARAARDFDQRFEQSGRNLTNSPELRAIDRRGAQYDDLAVTFGITSGVLFGAAAACWWLDLGLDSDVAISGDGSARVRYRGTF
jgi:hypothetical protein